MKRLILSIRRLAERITAPFLSKSSTAVHSLLRTEARQQKLAEIERLDRLRNPANYRGR